ncbi:MAG: glycosyltransferase [Planctomycetes bacterium]|nr:glycosyltransferase [Planctomycetota bacterium]
MSVFVQAYRTERWIGECIESVLSLRGGFPLEVIVIDDASPDGTARVVESFRDPRLRLVRHVRTAGATATASEGYERCAGEFVARIDSDDRYRPEFLQYAVPLLLSNARVGLVYGDIATIDPQGVVTSSKGNVRRGGRPPVGDELLPLLLDNFIPAPTTLLRRAAIAPFLPLPPQLRFIDWYLSTAALESHDSAYVDAVLADYRLHPSNMHRTMVLDRSGEATSLFVLDQLFARSPRQAEKRRWRRRVYAATYLHYAECYFGAGMVEDARRCYLAALRRDPTLLSVGIARHIGGVLIGLDRYGRLKARWQRARGGGWSRC